MPQRRNLEEIVSPIQGSPSATITATFVQETLNELNTSRDMFSDSWQICHQV